jgi:hypothetical protein
MRTSAESPRRSIDALAYVPPPRNICRRDTAHLRLRLPPSPRSPPALPAAPLWVQSLLSTLFYLPLGGIAVVIRLSLILDVTKFSKKRERGIVWRRLRRRTHTLLIQPGSAVGQWRQQTIHRIHWHHIGIHPIRNRSYRCGLVTDGRPREAIAVRFKGGTGATSTWRRIIYVKFTALKCRRVSVR